MPKLIFNSKDSLTKQPRAPDRIQLLVPNSRNLEVPRFPPQTTRTTTAILSKRHNPLPEPHPRHQHTSHPTLFKNTPRHCRRHIAVHKHTPPRRHASMQRSTQHPNKYTPTDRPTPPPPPSRTHTQQLLI